MEKEGSEQKDRNKSQAAQTLWEFVGLWISKGMYENKQNGSR